MADLPFSWHVPAMVVVIATYVVFRRFHLDRRHHLEVVAALVAALGVLLWPMGNLARSVSLSAAVVQRLVLMILVVPLLLRAVPMRTMERLTRPRVVDRITYYLSRPGVAILLVTVVGTATLVPASIDAAASNAFVNAVLIGAVVAAAVVLWIPALGMLPGSRRLSPAGRAGYLFASSLVVTSLSLVWIFSTHSLYPGLSGQEEVLGITPLLDQQLAGFIAKLGAYFPLWTISFYIFFHAEEVGVPVEESPLHWADVERQLLRVDRQRERSTRRPSRD